ncbi:putative LRR receptor-like protein kinase [Trifolium pratense]|uniref:non-specific serine/threonine protein kinase n=1 Tax=Trifolium pratense TaxID=57577 RepID=A0A2K3L443_TRIPR|nr:putative LRR receptor-like protein kinase [Trifolium pratense]
MEKGSLYCVLHNDVEAEELDWSKRIDIVKRIAHSLSYLHYDCKPPIIHRDVTTKNVLLNSEMEACLSDFGILVHQMKQYLQELMDILHQLWSGTSD